MFRASCSTVRPVLCLFLLIAPAAAAAQGPAPAGPRDDLLARFEGFTHPSRELVVESHIDGRLERIYFRPGDRFKAGDLLAALDDKLQAHAVEHARLQAQSKAQITAAQARLEEAEVELDNQRHLAKNNSATPREIRRAEAALAIAEAELVLAKENQALAVKQHEIEQERLELYRFKATFDGEVLSVATGEGAEEGAALRQNDPIMHVAQLDPIVAKISLPESVIGLLKTGRRYPLTVGSGAPAVYGTLKRVASVADRGSQLIEVEFEIPNPERQIRSGVRCRLASASPAEATGE